MRSLLEQHDIACELRNHHTSSLMGEVPFTNIWPELWVAESFADLAIDLISQNKNQDTSGPDWSCNRCQEASPANFDLCWQCSEPRQLN